MQWLIDDIAEHGKVTTADEARTRMVPDFTSTDVRADCPPEPNADG